MMKLAQRDSPQLNAISTTGWSSSTSPPSPPPFTFALLVIMQSALNSELYLYEISHAQYLGRQNTYTARKALCPDPSK